VESFELWKCSGSIKGKTSKEKRSKGTGTKTNGSIFGKISIAGRRRRKSQEKKTKKA